jgi:hypothetical protein
MEINYLTMMNLLFNKRNPFCYCCIISFFLVLFSCKKLVEVNAPTTSINSANVYASDPTAIAAVTDIYVRISSGDLPGGGIASLNLCPSLSSDELSLFDGATNYGVQYYYRNALSSTLVSFDFWSNLYQTVYVTNAAIEELNKSTTLSPGVKNQLLGEVKFTRALCYFYLLNLYGDVPLSLSSDYSINSLLVRKPKADVYSQIILDLKDAQNLLSAQYLNATLLSSTQDRVRPTRWAATALLARVYLYAGDYTNAENEATTLINNASVFSLVPLNNVFLKNSSEAIWQLQPVISGWNTQDARTFILPSNGPDQYIYPFYLSSQLLNSFETNDRRKFNWIKNVTVGAITYYYPYKYKSATYNDPVTEYEMVFRLGEQYLIRSEARVQLNRISEAKDDLNAIRIRAGLPGTTANDKKSLLSAILHERQTELFTEWGHRWFDLKRTNTVDAIMNVVTAQKGGAWNTNYQLYPISNNELLANPKLTQNPGY